MVLTDHLLIFRFLINRYKGLDFMQKVLYWISLPFIYGISILPFPLLYLLSDFCFLLICYVWGYRKKVILDNLSRAFPDKSPGELQKLRRKFYRNFTDQIFETAKTLTISKRNLQKRVTFSNPELIDQMIQDHNSLLIAMSHTGNWEWIGMASDIVSETPVYAIYRPLRNKQFDKMVHGIRSRFGVRMIPMKNTLRKMVGMRNENHALLVLADQTPSPKNAHWINFLGQDTPFFTGLEKMSNKFGSNMVYLFCTKPKRGRYHIEILPLVPEEIETGTTTKKFAEYLEKQIIEAPSLWLWSHRRWKHQKPA